MKRYSKFCACHYSFLDIKKKKEKNEIGIKQAFMKNKKEAKTHKNEFSVLGSQVPS